MYKDISDREYNKWVETGKPRKGSLSKIPSQIKKGKSLTLKEQSLLAFHTSEIEDILQNELPNY